MQAQHQQAFEEAVAGLRYGCVCVNVTSMMGFCIARLPWGAFPGNTPEVGNKQSAVSDKSYYCRCNDASLVHALPWQPAFTHNA